jgi:hypothetical protein
VGYVITSVEPSGSTTKELIFSSYKFILGQFSYCPSEKKRSYLLARYLYIGMYIILYSCIYLWLYSPCGIWPLFSFLIYTQSVGLLGQGISPSQGRCLHTEQHKHRITAHTQTSMRRVGFEATIPVFERAKTIRACNRLVAIYWILFIKGSRITILNHYHESQEQYYNVQVLYCIHILLKFS